MCQKLLESSHQERLRSLFSAREGRVRHAENKEDREVLLKSLSIICWQLYIMK